MRVKFRFTYISSMDLAFFLPLVASAMGATLCWFSSAIMMTSWFVDSDVNNKDIRMLVSFWNKLISKVISNLCFHQASNSNSNDRFTSRRNELTATLTLEEADLDKLCTSLSVTCHGHCHGHCHGQLSHYRHTICRVNYIVLLILYQTNAPTLISMTHGSRDMAV